MILSGIVIAPRAQPDRSAFLTNPLFKARRRERICGFPADGDCAHESAVQDPRTSESEDIDPGCAGHHGIARSGVILLPARRSEVRANRGPKHSSQTMQHERKTSPCPINLIAFAANAKSSCENISFAMITVTNLSRYGSLTGHAEITRRHPSRSSMTLTCALNAPVKSVSTAECWPAPTSSAIKPPGASKSREAGMISR